MKKKVIHLIRVKYGYRCVAACSSYLYIAPIEAIIRRGYMASRPKGTFNPKKVTCKRCLEHEDYKIAIDKLKYPLLFWKEGV